MKPDKTISAQRRNWSVVRKLGEGDAGEVYLMQSLLDGHPAILKRPRKGGFFSDVQRQARQIKTEGSILQGLGRVGFANHSVRLTVPAMIDQTPGDPPPGEQTFIVIEPAAGLDLKALRQITHSGAIEGLNLPVGSVSNFFVEYWLQFSEFPEPLLVRILLGVIELLETIHNPAAKNEQVRQLGIIWNDVKAEHLFWNPLDARLTVIDWGNSQFLKEDGSTKDRQFTYLDDFIQFVAEMGVFVADANRGLLERLSWPVGLLDGVSAEAAVQTLKITLAEFWETHQDVLRDLRAQEADLCAVSRPELTHLDQVSALWPQLAAFGELPDLNSLANLYARAALQMASEQRLTDFKLVCAAALKLPESSKDNPAQGRWAVLDQAASLPFAPGQDRAVLADAISAGVTGDWTGMLWTLFTWVGAHPLPEWWADLSQSLRRKALNLEPDSLPPFVVIGRSLRDFFNQAQAGDSLAALLRDDLLKKWIEVEPAPPHAGIAYAEFDQALAAVAPTLEQPFAPEALIAIQKALAQPKAQAELVLSAWERKDFDLAQKGLRLILLWDPDRRRLLTADRAVASASAWLSRLRRGASKDEPFYDFLTSVELAGRALRSQVGPARWLDQILEALKRLRKGARSVDLTIEFPDLQRDIPWLNEYRSREILSLPRSRTLTLERDLTSRQQPRTVSGVMEGRFGPGKDIALGVPLDNWVPEAQGSSARVFAGHLIGPKNRQPTQFAIKVMRPNRLEYALPLFCEETRLLTMLRDVPGISPLVECGYLKLEEGQTLPDDHSSLAAGGLQGQVIRYGAEEALNFLGTIERQTANGWLPYLALVERLPEHNLMRFCDSAYTHGWFLPLKEGLLLAIQICSILQTVHERNIVYRDHKILHYYWDPEAHGVVMIDWNIAKHHAQGLTDSDKQFDLVQFGARALHHILTGRPAPGSLPLGPNRPDEIENAAARYVANWTYDDERLPQQLKGILEQTLNQGYTQARELRRDLIEMYERI